MNDFGHVFADGFEGVSADGFGHVSVDGFARAFAEDFEREAAADDSADVVGSDFADAVVYELGVLVDEIVADARSHTFGSHYIDGSHKSFFAAEHCVAGGVADDVVEVGDDGGRFDLVPFDVGFVGATIDDAFAGDVPFVDGGVGG